MVILPIVFIEKKVYRGEKRTSNTSGIGQTLHTLEKYHQKVDIILSHDTPRDIKEYLGFYNICKMETYGEEYEYIHSVLFFNNQFNFKIGI